MPGPHCCWPESTTPAVDHSIYSSCLQATTGARTYARGCCRSPRFGQLHRARHGRMSPSVSRLAKMVRSLAAACRPSRRPDSPQGRGASGQVYSVMRRTSGDAGRAPVVALTDLQTIQRGGDFRWRLLKRREPLARSTSATITYGFPPHPRRECSVMRCHQNIVNSPLELHCGSGVRLQ